MSWSDFLWNRVGPSAATGVQSVMANLKFSDAIDKIRIYWNQSSCNLYQKVDACAQSTYITMRTVQASVGNSPLKELVDKGVVITDSLRDLSNKLATHNTLNPEALGTVGAIEVVGDLAAIVANLPKSIIAPLGKISIVAQGISLGATVISFGSIIIRRRMVNQLQI